MEMMVEIARRRNAFIMNNSIGTQPNLLLLPAGRASEFREMVGRLSMKSDIVSVDEYLGMTVGFTLFDEIKVAHEEREDK